MMNFKEKYIFFHKTLHLSVIKSLYYAWNLEVEASYK
jgi:hypothetical protein